MIPAPEYILSEPHLSGHRVVLGYSSLKDAQDAHQALASPVSPLQAGVDHAELLPCPFCGGKPIVGSTLDGGHYVMCGTDDCVGMAGYTETQDAALTAWNRRAAPVLPDRGWRPIESAPEKTDLLVCVTHNLGEDEWETVQWVDFRHGDDWCHFPRLIHVPFPPTHWMPLPDAPAEGAE